MWRNLKIIFGIYLLPVVFVAITYVIIYLTQISGVLKGIFGLASISIFPAILLLWGWYCSIHERDFGLIKNTKIFLVMLLAASCAVSLSAITALLFFSNESFQSFIINEVVSTGIVDIILQVVVSAVFVLTGYAISSIFIDGKELF